ncbi:5' nucleotidase, NT5C type [Candidatus Absconditicoccus praedator]|uniref:5' nucleotidase, NT5C type n=1 Tax=Candidatus Absconditicoccus praedator TaxID=2735562 RepID=UPI001E34A6B5|nr:HAD hydrolase-like protein [Candidatus Absconditicoccus praedator]UFX83231.1 HAD hydrolase-like protein [Candidatus Absconditicoccus praedator]
MRKIIGIDLDEVLSETVEHALKANDYKICGIPIRKEQINDYYIFRMKEFEGMQQEAVDFFGDFLLSEKAKEIKPVDGAYEKLKELKSAGYTLNVVTARRDFLKDRTYEWLDKNLPSLISDVYFTNSFGDNQIKKSEVIKKIGADYMFEDNFEYAFDVASVGVKTFLLEKPWNANQTENTGLIKRIASWNEFSLEML